MLAAIARAVLLISENAIGHQLLRARALSLSLSLFLSPACVTRSQFLKQIMVCCSNVARCGIFPDYRTSDAYYDAEGADANLPPEPTDEDYELPDADLVARARASHPFQSLFAGKEKHDTI